MKDATNVSANDAEHKVTSIQAPDRCDCIRHGSTIDLCPNRVVLVNCEWGVVIADFANGRWWSGFDNYGNDRELESVTHWMPLSAPPA